jgi:hypothetical protein
MTTSGPSPSKPAPTKPAPQPSAQTTTPPAAPIVATRKTIVPVRIKKGDQRAHYKTVLSYGRSRSGKTRWLGTWPRPLVLAEASERGWTTFETMPIEEFYEPDVDDSGDPLHAPIVWPVESAAQMQEGIDAAEALVLSGEVQTIGIDSLTFYQDAYFASIKERAIKSNPGKQLDTRALYGNLADHIHSLRQRIHRWPCNVVWLALELAPSPDSPTGGPMLTGKTKERFPAGCDFVFYHESYSLPSAEEAGKNDLFFEMHTRPFNRWLAGGRDSGLLEPSIFLPCYRTFAAQLGLPDDALAGVRGPARRVVSGNGATAPR